MITAVDAHHKFPFVGFNSAAGAFKILRSQNILNIIHRDPAGCHIEPVQPDSHGLLLRTEDICACNTVDHGIAVHQITVCIICQLHRGAFCAGECNDQHGHPAGVILGNHGSVRFIRQVFQNAADFVPHVVCSGINIPFGFEFQRDIGSAIHAVG